MNGDLRVHIKLQVSLILDPPRLELCREKNLANTLSVLQRRQRSSLRSLYFLLPIQRNLLPEKDAAGKPLLINNEQIIRNFLVSHD